MLSTTTQSDLISERPSVLKYKARVKSEYFNDQIYRRLTPMILTFILLTRIFVRL